MNLKEAFRYLNHLDRLAQEAKMYLLSRENCTLVTQTHRKSKVNAEAQDEILTTEQIRDNWNMHKDVMQVADFYIDLIREKQELSLLVARIKAEHEFRMDAELSANKLRQEVAAALQQVTRSNRPTRRITRGSAYKFNAEGNQVSYYYDIEESTEPAFDPKALKEKARDLQEKADAVSAEADAFLVNTEVSFEARYSVSDTFDDAFERYIA